MAVSLGHTSKVNTAGNASATSLSVSHNCTGDNFLLAAISTRGNVTLMTVTYDSVPMTLIAGPLTCTNGAFAQQWVFKLESPATGSNTLAFSWTGGAYAGAAGVSYAGVNSVNTPTQATGNLSYTQTVTVDDMVVGIVAIADTEAAINTAMQNTDDVASSESNQTGIGFEHNTGSGSVSVTSSYGNAGEIVSTGIVLSASSAVTEVKNSIIGLDVETIATTTNTLTLENKTVDLADNVVTGTKTEFNTALSDGDFLFSGDITQSAAIKMTIGNGTTVIPTGVWDSIRIPYDCTINSWEIVSVDNTTGSIVVDVWKDTYANFPPTIADTITGTEKPTISTSTKGQDLTLSSWTTAVSAGDYLLFNVDSVTSLTLVTLTINITKS